MKLSNDWDCKSDNLVQIKRNRQHSFDRSEQIQMADKNKNKDNNSKVVPRYKLNLINQNKTHNNNNINFNTNRSSNPRKSSSNIDPLKKTFFDRIVLAQFPQGRTNSIFQNYFQKDSSSTIKTKNDTDKDEVAEIFRKFCQNSIVRPHVGAVEFLD